MPENACILYLQKYREIILKTKERRDAQKLGLKAKNYLVKRVATTGYSNSGEHPIGCGPFWY